MGESICGNCKGGYKLEEGGKASPCPQCVSISLWNNSGIRDSFLRFSNADIGLVDPPWNKRIDAYVSDPPTYENLMTWIKGDPRPLLKEGKGLTFAGATSSGKTFLTIAILKRLIFDFQIPVKMVKAQHLVERVKHLRTKDPEEYKELIGVPLLFVDDLLTEEKFYHPYTFVFLDDRYSANLPTFITTNVPPEHFINYYGELYGPRIISRINRMNGLFIETVGKVGKNPF